MAKRADEWRVGRCGPDDVIVLRQSVLRPHLSTEEARYSADAAPETAHFCAENEAGRVVSVGSLLREAPPWPAEVQRRLARTGYGDGQRMARPGGRVRRLGRYRRSRGRVRRRPLVVQRPSPGRAILRAGRHDGDRGTMGRAFHWAAYSHVHRYR